MTQREWRRKKAETALKQMSAAARDIVRDLNDDFEAAVSVAKVAQMIAEARSFLAANDSRRKAG